MSRFADLARLHRQSYQSGYAAAVGDAAAVNAEDLDTENVDYDQGWRDGVDHYRTAIEALGSKK